MECFAHINSSFSIPVDKEAPNKQNILHNNIPVIQSVSHNEYIAPMVSPPLVGNMYHGQVQHPHVVIPSIIQHQGYVLPPNMVCYASPPIQATYPQQILIPSNAVHTFTPTGYYPVATTHQMVTSVTHSDYNVIPQNGTLDCPEMEAEIEMVNEIETELNEESHTEYTHPEFYSNDIELKTPITEQMPVISHFQPVIQNGLKTTSSPPGTKSWASLFNKSTVSQQQNGFLGTNEDNAEKVTPVAVNDVPNVCPIKHPKKGAQFIDPDCYRMGGKFALTNTF